MTESEFTTFATAFGRMCSMFRVKLKTDEAMELTRTYFKLLEPHRIDDVLRTGRALMETSRRLPLAVDWLDLLTKRTGPASADVRVMTVSELDEFQSAEKLSFIGQPCLCAECVRAGVDDRALRFVPTTWGEGIEDTAFNTRTNRRQVVGHWAHGEELRAWYQALDDFTTKARSFPRRMPRVFVRDRDPGQEG